MSFTSEVEAPESMMMMKWVKELAEVVQTRHDCVVTFNTTACSAVVFFEEVG